MSSAALFSLRRFADVVPRAFDVAQLGVGLADANSQRELAVQFCMREIQGAALVQAIHDFLVGSIIGAMPEANQIKRRWRGEFEITILSHP